MNDQDQLCELLYETVVAMAASIKAGNGPYAYMLAMLCMHQADKDFQYTRPHTEWFRQEFPLFASASMVMQCGFPDDAWYARHMDDILNGNVRDSLLLYYRSLFYGTTKAIHELDQGQSAAARQTLVQAQKEAEQMYLDETAW